MNERELPPLPPPVERPPRGSTPPDPVLARLTALEAKLIDSTTRISTLETDRALITARLAALENPPVRP